MITASVLLVISVLYMYMYACNALLALRGVWILFAFNRFAAESIIPNLINKFELLIRGCKELVINVGVTINVTCKYFLYIILLFVKDSKPDSVFEDKEWTFVIEDVS